MKTQLARSFDIDLIDSIIRDVSVYPFVSDDDSPKPSDFTCRALVENEKENIFVVVYDNYAPVGCFIFLGNELHTCMLPECRGRNAVDAGKAAIDYFFAISSASEVRSFAFKELPQTIWYARILGFSQEGEPLPHKSTREGQTLTRINFKKEKP